MYIIDNIIVTSGISTNGIAVSGHAALCLYHVPRISTNCRSVSGHKAPSTRLSNVDTVLFKFLETGTSDRTNISRD